MFIIFLLQFPFLTKTFNFDFKTVRISFLMNKPSLELHFLFC